MLKKNILLSLSLLLCTLIVQAQQTDGLLTPEMLWKLGRISGEQVSPDGNKVLYGVTNYDISENNGHRNLYVMNVSGGEPKQITNTEKSESNAVWTPDGKKIAFLFADKNGTRQIWEMNPDGTGRTQVSQFKESIGGFSYSQNMSRVVFIRDVKVGQTTKEIYPDLPKADAKIIDDLMYRHWDAWDDKAVSHVFYADYNNGKVTGEGTDIMEGEPYDSPLMPFGGMEEVTISPDGKHIVYSSKKKTGKEYAVSTNADLYLYDIAKKSTQNISKEYQGYDQHPIFSSDGKTLAWLSMRREGFESDKQVLISYDMASGKKTRVTDSFGESVTDFAWGPKDRTIYFRAGTSATYQLYSLNPKNGKIEQLTDGHHNINSVHVADGGNSLIASVQSMTLPTELFKINIKSCDLKQLTHINDETLSQISKGKVEKRMVKTTDGKDMLVWVIFPPNFDPNKKYPTLLYCQGGPQSAVSQFYSYRWNFQLMAANGYIIVAPNRRGLPTFGEEWNEQISQDWGGQAIKDYYSAIDELAKEPYVDNDRLGAVGASYGGYSVYQIAGTHNGRFKSFISHCGLFNLESWYGTTEEMFFANWDIGGPYWTEDRPEGYDKFSPHNFVQNWDTPILVIHGQKDFRVPVEQGIQAYNIAQLRGIKSRFLYFPEEGHWVQQPQNGVLWHREFFRWLDETLK